MKLAFTGDLSFHNIEKYTNDPFGDIANELSDLNLVVNLESVFLPKNDQYSIKRKICLRQNNNTIVHLKGLNPFLVNLSNNHINDSGNYGAENTKKMLEDNNIPYFGAGFSREDHNIFKSENEKIVFLSYATNSCDLSGSKLFNEQDFIGPKKFTLELLKSQIKHYKDYKKIVLLHWGLEYKCYPFPEQRILARKIIDVGADLIIGNHPHTIQGFERYGDKYIFYSLGNFLFPHFFQTFNKSIYQFKKSKESIIPVFDIKDEIILSNIIYSFADGNFNLHIKNKKIDKLNEAFGHRNYIKFYEKYSFSFELMRIFQRPYKILKKVRLYISLKNNK